MKNIPFAIAVSLGLLSLSGWQTVSPVHAAQHQSGANYQHESGSKNDNDHERNDSVRETEVQHQSETNNQREFGSKDDNDHERNDSKKEKED